MQSQLRKYKLEQVFKDAYEKPQASFLVLELLPTKEKSFVESVHKCNLLGFQVKYLKAKAAGGIINARARAVRAATTVNTVPCSLVDNPRSNDLGKNKPFQGNLIMIYPSGESSATTLKELLELGKLFNGLLLFLCHEGIFYHISTVAGLQRLKSTGSEMLPGQEVITALTPVRLITTLQSPAISVLNLLRAKSFKSFDSVLPDGPE